MIVTPLVPVWTVTVWRNFNMLTLFLAQHFSPSALQRSPPHTSFSWTTYGQLLWLLSLSPSPSIADIPSRGFWTKTRTCFSKISSVSCTTGAKRSLIQTSWRSSQFNNWVKCMSFFFTPLLTQLIMPFLCSLLSFPAPFSLLQCQPSPEGDVARWSSEHHRGHQATPDRSHALQELHCGLGG